MNQKFVFLIIFLILLSLKPVSAEDISNDWFNVSSSEIGKFSLYDKFINDGFSGEIVEIKIKSNANEYVISLNSFENVKNIKTNQITYEGNNVYFYIQNDVKVFWKGTFNVEIPSLFENDLPVKISFIEKYYGNFRVDEENKRLWNSDNSYIQFYGNVTFEEFGDHVLVEETVSILNQTGFVTIELDPSYENGYQAATSILLYGDERWAAIKFKPQYTTSGSWNVSFYGYRSAVVNGNITARLYNDNNDNVGTSLENQTFYATDITTSSAAWQKNFTFTTSVTANTWYWVVFVNENTTPVTIDNMTNVYIENYRTNDYYAKSTRNWGSSWSYSGDSVLQVANITHVISGYPYAYSVTTNIYGTITMCQSFTPSSNVIMNTTWLYIASRYAEEVSDKLYIYLRSGSCTGTILAKGNATHKTLYALERYIPVQLNQTITLNAETQYFLNVSSPASTSSYPYQFYYMIYNPSSQSFGGTTNNLTLGAASYAERDMIFGFDDIANFTNIKNLLYWSTLTSNVYGTRFEAFRFKTTSTGTLQNVSLYIRKSGSPPNMTVCLKDDNSTSPNQPASASLECFDLINTDVTTSFAWINVTGWTSSLSANTPYWIVLNNSGGTSSNYYIIQQYYHTATDFWDSYSTNSGGSWSKTIYDANLIIYTSAETLRQTLIASSSGLVIYGSNYVGQSFTPTENINLTHILWYGYKASQSFTNITIEIRSDNGTAYPSSTVLANSTDVYRISARGLYLFKLNSSVNLDANTRYWIVAKNPSGTTVTGYYYWQYNTYGPSSDGFGGTSEKYVESSNSGATWIADTTRDNFFALVYTVIVVPDTSFLIMMPSEYTGPGYNYSITGTTEETATETNWISFNFSTPPQYWVQPCTAGNFSNNQTGTAKPIYLIDNTGTVNISIYLRFNQAPLTSITLSGNATCSPNTCCGSATTTETTLTTSYQVFVQNMTTNSCYLNLTLWANASASAYGGESNITMYTKSNQTAGT